MPPIKTVDAEAALRQIIRERVDAVRGSNVLISKDEAKALDPFLQQADAALRAEGGAGTRVNVDALVEKAAQQAKATWDRFNPPGTRDGLTLAIAEVAQVKAADPALGALTELAMLRARSVVPPVVPPVVDNSALVAATKTFFDAVDYTASPLAFPGFTRTDARVGQPDRASVPVAVRDAFDFYFRVEAKDIGGAKLHKGTINGEQVWAMATTTDGDDFYLEVRKNDGTLLTGARGMADKLFAWDDFAGQTRLANLFVNGLDRTVKNEDGMSDDVERATAGQPPHDWPGDVRLATGNVRFTPLIPGSIGPGGPGMPTGGHFIGVDMPASVTPEQRDVATAAFQVLWEGMRPRLGPGDPFELGDRREGTMTIGQFTRPTDGKTYMVADWRDIDDGSFVLYFERTAQGPKLAISQFDN